jgi:hypothetical protein
MNNKTANAFKMAIEGLEQLLLFLYQEEETALYCNKFYEIQTAKKNIDECNRKINACKEALEAEQVCQEDSRVRQNDVPAQEASEARDKEFVTLTEDEVGDLITPYEYSVHPDLDGLTRAIEQELKDKNT